MPNRRPFTWVILVVNVLVLVWIVAGPSETPDGLVFTLWVFVDVILGVMWLVIGPRRRPCPVCGTDAKVGRTLCPNCGHDFAAAARTSQPR